MSREIKFRAWDKEEKKWYDWDSGVANFEKDKHIDIAVMDLDDGFEIMQFTGLKDKNGKEIYEGDIIRTYDYNDKWNDGAIGDVDWDDEDGGFRFNWKILLAKSGEKNVRTPIGTICSSSAYNSDGREGGIEVIGNIYENPELITDSKSNRKQK